jgi:CHAT domain-containing protein
MIPLVLLLLMSSPDTSAERLEWLLQHAAALQSQQQRRSDLAIPFLREAAELAAASGDQKHEAQALAQLGVAYRFTHQHDEALATLLHALDLARRAGDWLTEADALAGMGALGTERGDYDEAARLYQAVVDIGTKRNDSATRVRGLNGLAAVADRRGRGTEGLRYARAALDELDAGVREGKAFPAQAFFSVPYNLGKAISEAGNYVEASRYFERARDAAERAGNIGGMWHVLQETGEIYRAQGDLATAVRYYQRALAQAHRVESLDPEAMTLRALGTVAEMRGDFNAALAHYQEALALFERAGFRSELPHTLTLLSRAQFLTGQKQAARAALDRASALLATLNQPFGSVLESLESGRQKLQTGALAAAEADYLDAFATASANGLQSSAVSAMVGLANVARAQGKLEAAIDRYMQAAEAIDATRARIPSIDERVAFVSATHQTYEQWLDTLLEAGRSRADPALAERAFLVVERERSRNPLDALQSRRLDRPAAMQRLNDLISALQVQLATPFLTSARRRLLLDRLDDAERKLDLLQASTQSTAGFQHDVASMRKTLKKDEVFIEYTTRPNRVIVFLVTARGVSVFERSAGALGSRIEFFNDQLNSVNSEEAIRPGLALSRDLLGDLLPKIPTTTRRLVISVAGELAALPFDALPDPRDPSKPILSRYEVAYAPSLVALGQMRIHRSLRPRYDLLGVAPLAGTALATALPAYRSAALLPLPSSGHEVRSVARLVSGRADALVGPSATEEIFKRTPLRDYKVIHLATHALLDPQFPSRSGIVFARGSAGDDGWLQMREIYQLDLTGQLVVLSACQSAFGAVSSAEGMHSLARAFTYAGAKSVVGTLWKVEDTTAATIVRDMYSAIGRGQTVAAALRFAQLRTAGEHPYRNAREWAGWVVSGDAASHPDIASPALTVSSVGIAVAAGLVALLLAAFFRPRRRA